jgi:hypothetical protein
MGCLPFDLSQVSPAGEVLLTLMDPDGAHISSTAAATEHDGKLFIGNLAGEYVSYMELGEVDTDALTEY